MERAKPLRGSAPGRLAAAALVMALAGGGHAQAIEPLGWIMRVSDSRVVSRQELLADLSGARLAFVGEIHDQAGHHRAQLEVTSLLHESGAPVAVGLEMFESRRQRELDRWVAGEMSEALFVEAWAAGWDRDLWPIYRDVFMYAREHGIPLVGLNVPPEITGQVAARGFKSLTPAQLKELPAVDCVVDKAYEDFIRRALGDRSHSRAEFLHFCEAQMVWDTAMAANLLAYVERRPRSVVVIMAGVGHSWKYGIPAQVARQARGTASRILLPAVPGNLEPGLVTTADSDYLWLCVTESSRQRE